MNDCTNRCAKKNKKLTNITTYQQPTDIATCRVQPASTKHLPIKYNFENTANGITQILADLKKIVDVKPRNTKVQRNTHAGNKENSNTFLKSKNYTTKCSAVNSPTVHNKITKISNQNKRPTTNPVRERAVQFDKPHHSKHMFDLTINNMHRNTNTTMISNKLNTTHEIKLNSFFKDACKKQPEVRVITLKENEKKEQNATAHHIKHNTALIDTKLCTGSGNDSHIRRRSEVPVKEDELMLENECISGILMHKVDRYLIGKAVGQGAYAVVKMGLDKITNSKIAMKIYDKAKSLDTQRKKSIKREIKILEKLIHSNIVKLADAFDTVHHVYLIMEYVRGPSLHSYLKSKYNRKIDEEEAKKIFKQIASGISYCHSKSVSHRDIKLENVLLTDDGTVKIIDFGFSTCIPNDKKIKLFCGTPSYMAPEIVTKKEFAGPPADIWALGVLLYAILCGTFPFKGIDDKDLYKKIMQGALSYPDHLSANARNLITRMLNVDADYRPTADEILNDVWLKGHKHDLSHIWKMK